MFLLGPIGCQVYVVCTSPCKHRVCAVLLSWFPSPFAHVYLFCRCASPRKHRVCAVLLSSVPFPFCTRLFVLSVCFASQTPGLCSASILVPFPFAHVSFVLSVCFASQTPGLCCAVSSLPYKVVRFYALFVLYNRFCVAHFALQASGLLGPKPKFLFGFADSRLSVSCWKRLQDAFGGPNGHSVDLMALPSNVMRSSTGVMLPFFSPHPTPGCSGVNVFIQLPDIHPPQLFSYPYVFPPMCLIPNVLRFASCFRVSFTIVVPDVRPRRFWWALLPHCSPSSLVLAREGKVGVLHPPSKSGYRDFWPLPWDLWAFRIDPV